MTEVDSSLSKIDLSALSSKESEAAAQAAAAALQSLGGNTAALSKKLSSVQAAAEGLAAYREYLTAYSAQVEALKKAVDDNPAPVLSELAPELASALNEEASAQANAVVKSAAQEAAEEAVEEAAAPAVEEGIAAGVEKIAAAIAQTAAENAARITADAAMDEVQESIEESDALDDLGLTPEQIAAAKEQLIGEICGRIEAVPGDTSALASETAAEVSGGISSEVADRITDKINDGISVDPDAVEISLDELLAQTVAGMQKELDAGYGNIAAAGEAVGELTLPDMSALSGEEVSGISGILTAMGQDLAVVSAYAEGISSSAESLKGLAAGMEKLRTGISKLSEGSTELTGKKTPIPGSSDHRTVVRTISQFGDINLELILLFKEGIPQAFIRGNATGDNDIFRIIFLCRPHGFFKQNTDDRFLEACRKIRYVQCFPVLLQILNSPQNRGFHTAEGKIIGSRHFCDMELIRVGVPTV